nr:ferredoxin [Pseudaestuariivita rosea]
MTVDQIDSLARARGLTVLGAFHPTPDDQVPHDPGTLVMLGPHEPDFWSIFATSVEYADDGADPLDRWSRRIIGTMACDLGAKAFFPFGGPPFHPFITWAKRTGRAWASPVHLLVHDTAGLWVSYRGALALKDQLPLPPAHKQPCETCRDKPCLTACPVGALTKDGYDVPACKAYVSGPGHTCRETGCIVRAACPVSQTHGRKAEQAAFHMAAFL